MLEAFLERFDRVLTQCCKLLQPRCLFVAFEKLYLTQPLFRRFLALVGTAQVFSFARCDLVAFFHLFDHFTLAIFHEDVANSRCISSADGVDWAGRMRHVVAVPSPRTPNAVKSAPRHIAVATSIKGYGPRAGGLR
jgi:hypothetical protein